MTYCIDKRLGGDANELTTAMVIWEAVENDRRNAQDSYWQEMHSSLEGVCGERSFWAETVLIFEQAWLIAEALGYCDAFDLEFVPELLAQLTEHIDCDGPLVPDPHTIKLCILDVVNDKLGHPSDALLCEADVERAVAGIVERSE